ncbi:hypothetical protein N7532_003965 [Penicillium argentinense]|uniref:Mid2 domain-containing protein n=1 Tax=Penicillium argentinense TaxID=1131581 RepID=A0A9W9FNF1_9EURO|nr:uncharacterized protein N7532_003965 [Penicillium argentinense]KAJ5103436.1 hypothetical protein N7532_003965 [Penicillium argentinense]
MAHHGHWRNSRISRLLRAKHRLEAIEQAAMDDDSTLLTEDQLLATSDVFNPDCDPLQNTCLQGASEVEPHLSKRQATQNVVVETVIQVVDTNSQTLWQSVGVDFPMTISDPAFGAVTLSAGETAFSSEPPKIATSPTALPTIQSANSTIEATSPTSKQTATVFSPKASSAISSTPHTSIPLISTSTSTSSPTTSFIPTSIDSTSNEISKWPGESSPSSSTSSNWYGGSEFTGTGSSSGPAATTSNTESASESGSGLGSGAIDPTTSKIVGGVVGSVAGVALLLLLVLFFFRRRSLQQKGTQALPAAADSGPREVAERRTSKDPLFGSSYLAPAFMKRWRQSTMTTKTDTSTISSNPSERGFQKISGRKIPPVLTHGGDGFGGGLDGDSPTIPEFLGGLSPSSPGGPLSSPSHAPPTATPFGMPLDTNYTREAEENTTPTRPRQVHLPVSSSVTYGSPTTITPSHPIAQPQSAMPVSPPRKDGLGRSLPSFDGSRDSRGSRFTESLDL